MTCLFDIYFFNQFVETCNNYTNVQLKHKKNNKFVIAVDKIDNKTYISKIINYINQFKLLFKSDVVVFKKILILRIII